MTKVSKAGIQILLGLFVLNSAVCDCRVLDVPVSAALSSSSEDSHAHHQPAEADSTPDCHDGACLSVCDQVVVAKWDVATAFGSALRLELEPAFLDPVELAVPKQRVRTKISGPPVRRYLLPANTPVTRSDRLLS